MKDFKDFLTVEAKYLCTYLLQFISEIAKKTPKNQIESDKKFKFAEAFGFILYGKIISRISKIREQVIVHKAFKRAHPNPSVQLQDVILQHSFSPEMMKMWKEEEILRNRSSIKKISDAILSSREYSDFDRKKLVWDVFVENNKSVLREKSFILQAFLQDGFNVCLDDYEFSPLLAVLQDSFGEKFADEVIKISGDSIMNNLNSIQVDESTAKKIRRFMAQNRRTIQNEKLRVA